MSSLLSEQKTPLVPPTTYIPIWVPVNSPAEKIARAMEELKDVVASIGDCEASKSETSGKDIDSNGKKIDDVVVAAKLAISKPLLDAATGLTPGMKKMKVDNMPSSEEGELPKPRRERKKSKSKSGEIEKVTDGTVPVEKIVAKPEEKSVTANVVDEKTKATKLSAEKNKEDGRKDEVANKPKDASLDSLKDSQEVRIKAYCERRF